MFSLRRTSRRNRSPYSFTRSFFRYITLYVLVVFILIFAVTSISSIVYSKMNTSSSTFKKWTTRVSAETFKSALSMEITDLQIYNTNHNIKIPKISNVMLEMITSFNPKDPRSLIRRELPGFAFFDGQFIVAGQGVTYTDFPMDSGPLSLDSVLEEREATAPTEEKESEEKETGQDTNTESSQAEEPVLTTEGRQVVFIYHTHNRESWLPHVPSAKVADEAYHDEVNITMVGLKLGKELEKRGIGTYVDTTDITKQLKDADMPYSLSYAKSRSIVETALAQQKNVTLMFDLHRDSHAREKTTIEINGKNYARTYFIVGAGHKNYEENQKLAEKFHYMLEKAYPGLSRGVVLKEKGNSEYNQSLFANNLLVEIGGVENTLEESYRTAEALADVIADLYWDAEKVDSKLPDKQS